MYCYYYYIITITIIIVDIYIIINIVIIISIIIIIVIIIILIVLVIIIISIIVTVTIINFLYMRFVIFMFSDWVSFLAYINLFGIKGFVVVVAIQNNLITSLYEIGTRQVDLPYSSSICCLRKYCSLCVKYSFFFSPLMTKRFLYLKEHIIQTIKLILN
jgi:hypothetical protein